MTTYTFRCPNGHEFPIPARLDEQPPTRSTCPECLETARRVFVAPAVVYRGEGWTGAGKDVRRR